MREIIFRATKYWKWNRSRYNQTRVIACKDTSRITNLDPPWPLDRLPLLSSSSSSSSSLEVASDWGTEEGALLPESGPGPILEPEAPLQDGARPPSPCPSSFSARSTYNFTTNRNFEIKISICLYKYILMSITNK